MHRPELFQTKQTELKLDKNERGEAFLVNCGQTTDNRRQTQHDGISSS